jgi:peptide/nickel transport system permease protein
MALGIAVGACMGWFGGWIDTALMRFVEAAMSIPVLLILVVAAGVLPRQIGITILVIGLITWTDAARLTRAEFLRLRDQDFALAARASGASAWRTITLHLLPSALPPVLVEASFALAAAILFEASLSFLGLGPTEGASWGRLLAQGLDATGRPLWWITVPAGSLIFLTVVSLHAVGDTLRHRLLPIR